MHYPLHIRAQLNTNWNKLECNKPLKSWPCISRRQAVLYQYPKPRRGWPLSQSYFISHHSVPPTPVTPWQGCARRLPIRFPQVICVQISGGPGRRWLGTGGTGETGTKRCQFTQVDHWVCVMPWSHLARHRATLYSSHPSFPCVSCIEYLYDAWSRAFQ